MTPGAETKLWQRLADVDLVQGAMPPDDALGTHWAIRVMLGVSAWVAAVLLLGVVGLLLDFHVGDGTLLLVLGGLQVGGAYLLLGRGEAGVFAGQFALALSIAGQLLVLLGLQQLFQWDLRAFGFAAALLEAGLFLAVPGARIVCGVPPQPVWRCCLQSTSYGTPTSGLGWCLACSHSSGCMSSGWRGVAS